MSSVRTWHLKNELSDLSIDERWDYCPMPIKNESFSSWFTRLSKGNYSEPLMTLKKFSIHIDNLDSYYITHSNKLIKLISPFLKDDIDFNIFNLNFKFNEKNQYNKKIFYNKYCPKCLKQDSIPFFRKNWMHPFITICQRHRILLKRSCPHCGARIEFWKSKWFQRISICHYCHDEITEIVEKEKIIDKDLYTGDWQVKLISLMNKNQISKFPYYIKENLNIFELFISLHLKKLLLVDKDSIFYSKKEILNKIFNIRENYPLMFTELQFEVYSLIKSNIQNIEKPYICNSCNKIKLDYSLFKNHLLICHYKLFCPSCCSANLNILLKDRLIYCRECYLKFALNHEIKGNFKPKRIPNKFRKKNHLGTKCPFCNSTDTMNTLIGIKCKKCWSLINREGNLLKKGFLPPICSECKSTRVYFRKKIFKFRCKNCSKDIPIFTAKKNLKQILQDQIVVDLKFKPFPYYSDQYKLRPKDRLHWIDRKIFEFIKLSYIIPVIENKVCNEFRITKFTLTNTINHLIKKSLIIETLYSERYSKTIHVGYICNYFEISD